MVKEAKVGSRLDERHDAAVKAVPDLAASITGREIGPRKGPVIQYLAGSASVGSSASLRGAAVIQDGSRHPHTPPRRCTQMNIRKLVLPTMIAALMAAPAAFAQSADLDAQAQAQQAQAAADQAEAQAVQAEAQAAAAAQQANAAEQSADVAQDRADFSAEAAAQEQAVEPEEEDERN